MKSAGQLLVGLLTAIGSSLLVLTAMALALAEGGIQRPEAQATPSATSLVLVLTPAGGVTLQPSFTPVSSATAPMASQCNTPKEWQPYTVMAGDELAGIAEQANLTAEDLLKANCLLSTALLPGTILYVPNLVPVNTIAPVQATAVPCGPPPGWVTYTVRPGDTLFSLSLELRITVAQLQNANCLTSTNILAGARLSVPFVPQRTPLATATPAPTSTLAGSTITPPVKPGPTTETPTPDATKQTTPTSAPTVTDTPTPEPTATTAPSATLTPENPGSSAFTLTPQPTQGDPP